MAESKKGKPRKKTAGKAKAKRRRSLYRGMRATVVTKDHPQDRSALQGSEERLTMLRYRALRLKIEGHYLREIGEILTSEFNLIAPPPTKTIWGWIEMALADAQVQNKEIADKYVAMLYARSEASIGELAPYAFGKFLVQKHVMVDGVRLPVIDADMFKQKLDAIDGIRKQGEIMLRAFGINSMTTSVGGSDAKKAVGIDNIQTFILNSVTNHYIEEKKAIEAGTAPPHANGSNGKVLELSSGNKEIDDL